MKNLYIIALLLAISTASAQHDNIWYFGQWAGLQFTNGIPSPLTDSALSTVEGSAVMSDENGVLMFYTNGITVYNKNHQVMINGTGLLGGTSTTQAALIIPKPGQPSHYYIFTPDDEGGPDGLHYSEVDMDADGGLGAVINKNIPLITPVCEKVMATYHANGTDIWVITHHWGSNSFYSYLVTAAGVSATPVISNAGMVLDGASNSGRYAGHMAISPDGSHLAIMNSNVSVELFDLNIQTGIISNSKVLKTGVTGYGIEFSPSGNMLYAAADTKLLQYQVNIPNPAATESLITNLAMPAAIRIGPDSKLYIITSVLSENISVINKPDLQGAACNFVLDQVNLDGRKTLVGLPTFLTSPFYITGMDFIKQCEGNNISFSLTSTLPPDNVMWDFGDGNMSNEANPFHSYAAPGTYIVKATAKKGIFRRFFSESIVVAIQPLPVANQPQDMVLCEGNDEGSATFLLSGQNAEILGTQPPANFTVTYHISQTDADLGSNDLTDAFSNTSNPQTIYARVEDNTSGCYATTSFALIVQPKPVVELQDEYFVCDENIIVLTAPIGFDTYEWSTGETTRTIFAGPGTYTLTVTKNYGTITCSTAKTIKVTRSAEAVIKDIKINDWTDDNNSITVVAEGVGDYEYSIDGINYQASPVFNNLQPGFYTVFVRDRNGCGITQEETALLMFPSFFTPNGDGNNDIWRIKYANFEPELIVNILDRYGKVVNSFTGSNTGWDGTLNGRSLPATDYWFVVQRKDGREHRGHFSMIR